MIPGQVILDQEFPDQGFLLRVIPDRVIPDQEFPIVNDRE